MRPAELEALRQQLVERLTEAYANDEIELEEFEVRVERAEGSADQASLEEQLADLGGASAASTALTPGTSTALVLVEEVPEKRSLVTVFGSVTRNKRWTVPRRLRVVSIFGGTDLDFREARLAPGVTEIHVVSVMAGVQVLVPPDLPVEVDGTGILGAFEETGDVLDAGAASACRLRITGFALLSGVAVEQRLPGETSKQARKRRKRQKRALKAAAADRLLVERASTPPRDHRAEE